MNNEARSFIVSPEDVERVERHTLDPKNLIANELESDYHHYFSKKGREIMTDILSGAKISNDERALFDQERAKWWQDKYGFPYERSTERNEVIVRKYIVPEDLVRRRSLQVELFAAVRANDYAQLQKLRSAYETEYPDQLEGVDVLLEFPSYLELQEKVNLLKSAHHSRDEREARKDALQSLTGYHFLISHFVEQNSDDKEFLREFWGILEEMGVACGNLRQAQITRRGVLSQVAAMKIFDRLGQHPKLSHPSEDAFDAIDMWTDGDVAVQIKTGHQNEDELLVDTDEVTFPGVQTTDSADNTRIINTDLMRDISRFQTKSVAYGKRVGKNISGCFAVIPKQSYDHVTGTPTEDIVQRFATKLGIAFPRENP